MKKAILATISLYLFGFAFVGPVNASSLQPSLNTIHITEGATIIGTLTYENSSDREQLIEPILAAYDPKSVEFVAGREVFLESSFTGETVAPGESIFIDYEIFVPLGTNAGTYFNVLAAIERNASQVEGSAVGLEIGGGALFSINVFATDNSGILSSEDLTGELEVIQEGIYLIRPAIVQYTFTNATQYVLRPVGELRAVQDDGVVLGTEKMNLDDAPLYEREALTKRIEYEVPFWEQTSVVATLAESLSGQQGSNSVDVSNYSVYIWTIIIGFTLSGILWLQNRIRKWYKDRKRPGK